MAYQGEDFQTERGCVSVRVYDDGKVRVSEFGHGDLTEEAGAALAEFIRDQLYEIRKRRGDFDPVKW